MAQVEQIIILTAAEAELLDATAYYNQQSEGLGFEFAAEVQRTIERIIRHPPCLESSIKANPQMPHQPISLRRCLSNP
jgi:hypothetical protein